MGTSQWQMILPCAVSAAAGVAAGIAVSRFLRGLSEGIGGQAASISDEGWLKSALLLEAASFSAEKHRDQRRKNSKHAPYINHPIRVARLLAVDAGVADENILVAALLHDTVEDTNTTIDEIVGLFGSDVAKIVDEVSDDKSLPKDVRKQLQIEHAPHCSRGAKLVKLADKLDNLTDLLTDTPIGWQPERVVQYFEWAEKVIQGLRGTHAGLEEKLENVLARKGTASDIASAAA